MEKLINFLQAEAATGVVLYKKMFLKIFLNSQKNTSGRVSFLIKLQALSATLLKRDCETFKNSYFIEDLRTTASVLTVVI